MRISVLLVEDHPIVRQGLNALISTQSDIFIAGEAGDGEECLQLARETGPDVVLMDIAMPKMNGAEATRRLKEELPATKVVILSSYGHNDFVKKALAAGAAGYVLKRASADELLTAIRQVHAGEPYFSEGLNRALRAACYESAKGQRQSDPQELSPRQQQVLELIAEGYSNKQIAGELGISRKTVEKHRQALMTKLDLHEPAGVTRYLLGQKEAKTTM